MADEWEKPWSPQPPWRVQTGPRTWEYVPTDDGAFEAFMDGFESGWDFRALDADYSRAIWEAARARYTPKP